MTSKLLVGKRHSRHLAGKSAMRSNDSDNRLGRAAAIFDVAVLELNELVLRSWRIVGILLGPYNPSLAPGVTSEMLSAPLLPLIEAVNPYLSKR